MELEKRPYFYTILSYFFLPNSPFTSAASALAVLPEYSSLCTPKGMSLRAMAMPSEKGNRKLVFNEQVFNLTQCNTKKNPRFYQCVPVQQFPLCCQTDHNHTSREASMSSSHRWERRGTRRVRQLHTLQVQMLKTMSILMLALTF